MILEVTWVDIIVPEVDRSQRVVMDNLLTVSEAARVIRVREETVRDYIRKGRLPARALPGGYYRIREEDLKTFLRPVNRPLVETPR